MITKTTKDTGLNVLSLFDGAGTLRLALQMAGIEVGKYYASEIKPVIVEFMKQLKLKL